MIHQSETIEERGQVWECAGCHQYGPRNTPFQASPWRWRAEDQRWVHACGVGGDAAPNPARLARATPRAAVAAVYADAYRKELPRRTAGWAKELAVWLLVAFILADKAPAGAFAFAAILLSLTRALWCGAHVGIGLLIQAVLPSRPGSP